MFFSETGAFVVQNADLNMSLFAQATATGDTSRKEAASAKLVKTLRAELLERDRSKLQLSDKIKAASAQLLAAGRLPALRSHGNRIAPAFALPMATVFHLGLLPVNTHTLSLPLSLCFSFSLVCSLALTIALALAFALTLALAPTPTPLSLSLLHAHSHALSTLSTYPRQALCECP
jgi:hypothetical protein